MKQKFINSSITFITKYQECDDLKIKKIKYGLEGIYNLILKLSVVILIAILTNSLKETLLFILFYIGIRSFSFGWHAKTSLGCWITTVLVYNFLFYLFQKIYLPTITIYAIIIVAILSMVLWTPADTPKRPLIRKEQRQKAKIMSIIVVILYIIIYFNTTNIVIKNTIIYALLIQSILVNPLTYKITNTRFNNYKYYKKK